MSNIRFKHDQDVTIGISEKLYNDILSLVNSTDLEMTLLLELEKLNTYDFRIINYFIPPQWNESAESKTLDSKYPQWCMEQIKAGHKLNGHMHSHPSFSVTPSGYDNTFFKELINETNSFQARFIINQKGFITADIINETDNYIAEDCTVKIICDNFNILANATEFKADVDFDKLEKENICIYRDLTVGLIGKYLTLNNNKLIYSETVKYTPTRKQDTDEGYKWNNQPSNWQLGYDHNRDAFNYLKKFPEDEFYGYTDEEIQIAKDMHFKTADELEEYLLEMEAFADANSK